jgi:glycine oxidase
MKPHVTVIGGGAIGLSIAYELLQRGYRVRLLERGPVGRQASWAGAGILAPAHPLHSLHPLDRLAGRSSQLHQEWAAKILRDTDHDVGYWNCGGLYLARTAGESALLLGQRDGWQAEQIPHELRNSAQLESQFAGRVRPTGRTLQAVWVPSESQIRNPHFIAGLRAAIEMLGGELLEDLGELKLFSSGSRISRIESASGWSGDCEVVCVAAGAWSYQLLSGLEIRLPVEPVRGQMVLFQLDQPLGAIINEGSRYLVPRKDGHLLAGSTMEEVGFDDSTTENEISGLIDFAASLLPEISSATVRRSWAGLRPASFDGLPYVGWIPDWENLIASTGHLRSGLQLAPGNAALVADLLEEQADPELVRLLSPARLGRSLK